MVFIESQIKSLTLKILSLLSERQFDIVVAGAEATRLSAADLKSVIDQYGKTLIAPSSHVANLVDIIEVKTESHTWSITSPLWTREEGRSDLSIELTVLLRHGRLAYKLDDLHVL